MRRTTPPSRDRKCVECDEAIPACKRADASYCSQRCVNAAEKRRYCAAHPDYVARQRRQVARIHHLKEHGHTRFIDNPIGNPKDRFRVARSLGYRSMLEVQVAKQIGDYYGCDPKLFYERMKVPYVRT
jgi:hypothetical protein